MRLMLFCCFILQLLTAAAQPTLQSPEQFLGYKIGTRYTPHHKIVSYFQHVAAAKPNQVKLQVYGKTYEDRPLMVAFVGSANNIANLENIRQSNLKLTGLLEGSAIANQPTISWLSYNVHGNEPASSEAALLTIYGLLTQPEAQQWLSNTVVIMDPCLNPDGRDRYVNWYNGAVGTKYNPVPFSREHREPWPNGRSNHYNFDLNRDWAWQSQTESRQRIQLYQQWMPQVHVDFHEQGYNEPYYFAPAAEPFHDVITRWQRDFQNIIGKNHAKYFDQQGWLYFTKERFDLFYPSYGDTYPTYNGSVGMTYEQGGIGGGLGVITEDADTLTLVDRALHHYTTGMSTVEMSSKNADKSLNAFKDYFQAARNTGFGEYKAFILQQGDNQSGNLYSLLQLLDRNGIRYYKASGSGKGFNYFTGKEESYTTKEGDVVVPTTQPRSGLVRVLFEPRSKLTDSVTYDITAWALPYTYGVQAYAVKEKLNATSAYTVQPTQNVLTPNAYAYAIRWNNLKAAKFLGRVLKAGVRVRYAEAGFELNGQRYQPGTLLITRAANQAVAGNLHQLVQEAANAEQIKVDVLSTGMVDKGADFGSDKVRMIRTPKIAMLTGDGVSSLAAGEVWHFFDEQLNYPITLINNGDMNRVDWKSIDVLILPDGNYRFLNDKSTSENLQAWVRKGGRLIALEGAVAQLSRYEWGIKSKKFEPSAKDPYALLKPYEERERDFVSGSIPGAILKVEVDTTHPLAFGFDKTYFTLKQDDQVYEFTADGWNVGVIKKDAQVAGFIGTKLKDKFQDGLLFGVQDVEQGQIIYLADNPLFRSFWENGKLLMANAAFLVGQ